MSRKGKDFEKLVALLEESLTPQGITVTSPEYFTGKQSLSRREVDITLRSTIGSSQILVIVECRERDGTEDVRWVEEVIGKIPDIGADKAVIVSSDGFSKGAINLAKAQGIEIRTLQEVDPSEFSSWLAIRTIRKQLRMVNFFNTTIVFPEGIGNNVTISPQINTHDKIFRMKKNGNRVSFFDLWLMAKTESLYVSLKPNVEKKKHHIRIRFDTENDGCEMQVKDGFADIDLIDTFVEIWLDEKIEPLKKFRRYENEEGVLSEIAECDFEINGERKTIALHNIPQKEGMRMSISLRNPE